MKIIPFDQLPTSNLIVDAVYESSSNGQLAGDPISKLLPGTGNMGGFRVSGRGERKNWVVLFTTGEDSDWPDCNGLILRDTFLEVIINFKRCKNEQSKKSIHNRI